MVHERGGRPVATRVNSASARTTWRRKIGDVTPSAPPQTVQELAAAILAVIRRYRDAHEGGACTDVALALAIADRENSRAGRR